VDDGASACSRLDHIPRVAGLLGLLPGMLVYSLVRVGTRCTTVRPHGRGCIACRAALHAWVHCTPPEPGEHTHHPEQTRTPLHRAVTAFSPLCPVYA